MPDIKLPEILVFAGPNGSEKSTVTKAVNLVGKYINADEIKAALNCDNMEAAIIAEKKRNEYSESFFRIFKKRKTEYFYWENEFWNKDKIISITKQIGEYK